MLLLSKSDDPCDRCGGATVEIDMVEDPLFVGFDTRLTKSRLCDLCGSLTVVEQRSTELVASVQ